MSQNHSVAAPVRSASWLRSGISVSSSDSTSRADKTGSPSIVCSSPSTRTEGCASVDRYRVDAPRAADTRSSRSSPLIVGSCIGGGWKSVERIGFLDIDRTVAGGTRAAHDGLGVDGSAAGAGS